MCEAQHKVNVVVAYVKKCGLCTGLLLIKQDRYGHGLEPIVRLRVFTRCSVPHIKILWRLSWKVLTQKINALIWFHCMHKDDDQSD